MIVPEPRRERRTEHARRIHCRAGEWTAKQNIERNGCADGKSGDSCSPRSLINRGSVNNKDKKEGENGFDQNSLHSAQIDGQLRRSGNNNIAAKQAETNQSRDETAKELRSPVTERILQCHVTTAEQPKSDRRIEVAS